MSIIRVVKTTTNDFGKFNHGKPSRVSSQIIWEGSSVMELSELYPPSQIFGADPLGHSEIEDGLIRIDHKFERKAADGSWEEIDDPRVRVTPATEAEREIDAENRRLYPGDYITEDEYCPACGYPGCRGECEDDDIIEPVRYPDPDDGYVADDSPLT